MLGYSQGGGYLHSGARGGVRGLGTGGQRSISTVLSESDEDFSGGRRRILMGDSALKASVKPMLGLGTAPVRFRRLTSSFSASFAMSWAVSGRGPVKESLRGRVAVRLL